MITGTFLAIDLITKPMGQNANDCDYELKKYNLRIKWTGTLYFEDQDNNQQAFEVVKSHYPPGMTGKLKMMANCIRVQE